MVERCALPTIGSVAPTTICSKLAIMLVILLMAGKAILRRAFEHVVDVALLAFYVRVFALQLERGQVMVERGVLPTIRGVTRPAIRPKLSVVMIVFLMARITILRCRLQVCNSMRVLMTIGAGNFRVPAL